MEIYLDAVTYRALVRALMDAAVQPCAVTGERDPDAVKIALGEVADIWPEEIREPSASPVEGLNRHGGQQDRHSITKHPDTRESGERTNMKKVTSDELEKLKDDLAASLAEAHERLASLVERERRVSTEALEPGETTSALDYLERAFAAVAEVKDMIEAAKGSLTRRERMKSALDTRAKSSTKADEL